MANIYDDADDIFERWDELIEADIEFEEKINKFNEKVQTMYFLDEARQHTRNAYFSLDQAEEQLKENFNFEDGKHYLIKYLTNYGWKSAKTFQYRNGIDVSDYTYNEETEIYLYNDNALNRDEIHVYGIVVEEA